MKIMSTNATTNNIIGLKNIANIAVADNISNINQTITYVAKHLPYPSLLPNTLIPTINPSGPMSKPSILDISHANEPMLAELPNISRYSVGSWNIL